MRREQDNSRIFHPDECGTEKIAATERESSLRFDRFHRMLVEPETNSREPVLAFGLDDLLKLAAEDNASRALQEGLKAASEGVGRELADTDLSPAQSERIAQIRWTTSDSEADSKLEGFVHLAEEVAALGLFVGAVREAGGVTDEEQEAVLDAVEEVGSNALKVIRELVQTR